MNLLKVLLTVLCCLYIHVTNAQLSGGGELNPDLKAPVKAQKEFMDRKIGLSVHWGPSCLGEKEISWSRGDKISREEYDNFYREFDPVNFDANEWGKLFKRWGIRYMAPTGKHHDGFTLWYSKYTDYDMENAKGPIDLMAAWSKACENNDIWFGSYYSNLDWYHPDWMPQMYGGPGDLIPAHDDSPNLDRYFKFMENQVLELINNYNVKFVQFDGEWDSTYTHQVGSRLYRTFKEANPDVLLSTRIDKGRIAAGNEIDFDGEKFAGDYQERERITHKGNNVFGFAKHPWQAWVTLDKGQWSYRPNPVLLSANDLIIDMVNTIGNNGNYMINLGPKPDGTFDPEQVELMNKLGEWIHKHSKAIYYTRGGPYYPFNEGVSTFNKKKAWLFITDSGATDIQLPELTPTIVSAKVFSTNIDVPFLLKNNEIIFDISKVDYQGPVKVIELKFSKSLTMPGTIEK
ncbi:MAG: alpha-L-fucosidase [Bacteroidales bacterium]|nr:alpha-L-fucosidase [Bacteroidales bacterium]